MKNIEIKVKLDDFRDVLASLKKANAKYKDSLKQIDTYFNCEEGRCKLREINKDKFELIFYKRPDYFDSKISEYKITNIKKRRLLSTKKELANSYGIKTIVKKKRDIWILGHTRIHLDKVDKLGKFLELESVIKGISEKRAKIEHKEIMNLLNLSKYKKCSISYGDMADDLINRKKRIVAIRKLKLATI